MTKALAWIGFVIVVGSVVALKVGDLVTAALTSVHL